MILSRIIVSNGKNIISSQQLNCIQKRVSIIKCNNTSNHSNGINREFTPSIGILATHINHNTVLQTSQYFQSIRNYGTTSSSTPVNNNQNDINVDNNNSSNNTTYNKPKIQNNLFQKVLLGVGSSIMAMYDPTRADMVAALGEVTGECQLPRLRKLMMSDEDGRWLLENKPRIKLSTLPEDLKAMPEGTFGHAYLKFMNENGFSPDERLEVRMVENEEDAYVLQRYREVHDFWHVLAGIGPTVPGEIAIKWLEMIQTGLPVTALSAFIGPLRLSFNEQQLMIKHMIPWALRAGRNAKPLLNIRYENYWNVPLDEFRKKLNFEPYTGPLI